jgi:hypothetical protein
MVSRPAPLPPPNLRGIALTDLLVLPYLPRLSFHTLLACHSAASLLVLPHPPSLSFRSFLACHSAAKRRNLLLPLYAGCPIHRSNIAMGGMNTDRTTSRCRCLCFCLCFCLCLCLARAKGPFYTSLGRRPRKPSQPIPGGLKVRAIAFAQTLICPSQLYVDTT